MEREKLIDVHLDVKKTKFDGDLQPLKPLGREILRMGKFWALYMSLCQCKDIDSNLFRFKLESDSHLIEPYLKPA